jgi:hypothetical protein
MKYTVRESLTGSGNWFVETEPGHDNVALVRSETLARQIADLLEHGVLGDGVRYEFPKDTPEGGKGEA